MFRRLPERITWYPLSPKVAGPLKTWPSIRNLESQHFTNAPFTDSPHLKISTELSTSIREQALLGW